VLRTQGRHESSVSWGAKHHGLREDDIVVGRERCRGLGDEACVVDGATDSVVEDGSA
jgi:hypothetical protein